MVEKACASRPLDETVSSSGSVESLVKILAVNDQKIMPRSERIITAKTAHSQSLPPAVM